MFKPISIVHYSMAGNTLILADFVLHCSVVTPINLILAYSSNAELVKCFSEIREYIGGVAYIFSGEMAGSNTDCSVAFHYDV